ncbi:MAG: hypothetical protein NVS2B16_02620 [Chloroflexota bacterium]
MVRAGKHSYVTGASSRRIRVPLLVIFTILIVGAASIMVPRGTAAPRLLGTIVPSRSAPDFRLLDQFRRPESLRQWRGHPVVLTFTQATCTQLCPVAAETIQRTIAEVGPKGQRVAVLAISVDPEHDTPTAIRHFLRQHRALQRWHYLTGTRAQLRPIWDAYHLYVAPANASPREAQAHTSATYLIDALGHERVLMGGDPNTSDLAFDVRLFLGISATTHGSLAVPAPEVDHAAPALVLPTLHGRTVSLASLRGKVVVLNFWATWCTACASEIPRLSRWYPQVARRGILVLGIDVQEDAAAVRAYARKYGISYPILLDASGTITARYDAAGLPKTVVVDQQGVVQSVKLGVVSDRDLATHVQSLVSPPA